MNSRAAHDTVRGMLAATRSSGGQAGLHGLRWLANLRLAWVGLPR
jgi:hypothetical protein